MTEETSTAEDKKTEVFVTQSEHQRMLWDPSDHSCNNRNKRKGALLWQIAEDLGVDSLLF